MSTPSDVQLRIRKFAIGAFVALVAFAYSLPLLLCLYLDADFTAVANESIAYRYFAVERVRGGEGGNIWLPQGHLTTAFHGVATSALDLSDRHASLTFRQRLNRFSYLALAINVVLVSAVMLFAIRNRSLGFAEHLLLAVVLLTPIYAARINGFYYHLYPDYLAVSVILLAVALLIILVAARRPPITDRAGRADLSLGAFLGLMVANKITLVVPGFLLTLCAFFQRRPEPRQAIIFAAYLTLGAIAAIGATLLLIYDFKIRAIREMLPRWYRFAQDPGSEPDFWSRIHEYIQLYFGYAAAYASVALAGYITVAFVRKAWSPFRLAVLFGSLSVCFAAVLYVARRPAQTTFFEAFCMLVFVSSVLIGTLPCDGLRKRMALVGGLFWLVLAALTFPVGGAMSMIAGSRAMADERWAMFQSTLEVAAGRQILVVFPSNEFYHSGVHELILKASAVFPTWDVDKRGQQLIEKLSPRTRYYHEYNPIGDLSEIVKDATVIVWFDRADLAPLQDKYPPLRELLSASIAQCERGEYHNDERIVTHVWWRCIRR